MLCERCMVIMKTGTSYKRDGKKYSAKRYEICPSCHSQKYNNSPNFQELLAQEFSKNNK